MCLAVAGRVAKIEGDTATVDFNGLLKHASTLLFPLLTTGDYVLVHAGFVIQKLEEEYARELIELGGDVSKYNEVAQNEDII